MQPQPWTLLRVLLALAALAVTASSTHAQSAGAPPVTPPAASINFVRVMHDASGRTRAVANYSRNEDFTAYIYTTDSMCTGATDSRARPATASFGWEVTGHFTSRSASEVVVRLDWHRAWEKGQPISAPSGTLNLALRAGDRMPIDLITTEPVAGCTAVRMTLDVAFAGYGAPIVAGAGTIGGTFGSGGGGISGVGGGGGVVNTTVVPDTIGPLQERAARMLQMLEASDRQTPRSIATVASAAFTSPIGASVSVRSNLDLQTLQTVTVELWLVDRLPNGTEASQYRSVQTTPADGAFGFDPVVLSLPDGIYGVQIKGFVQAQRTADGTEKVEVGLLRRLSVLAVVPDGGPPGNALRVIAGGSSAAAVPMPKQGEVISFEMPAPRVGDVPLGGHQFSLRVRVVK